ncbi:nSTAND1 domain-containing NTPase, partial [Actinocorallia lasiicapitis]
LGDGTSDTRRPVPSAELEGIAAPEVLAEVLERLAAERLVVLSDGHLELGHEALIGVWPRLRGWLEEDRADLEAHRRLTLAAGNWRLLGGDPGALYRGGPLLSALAWAAEHPGELNRLEQEFLRAARTAEAGEVRAVRQRNRRLRRLLAVSVCLLLLAVAGGWIAEDQRNEAARSRTVERAHQ